MRRGSRGRTCWTTDVFVRRATLEDVDAFVAVVVDVADERRWIATEPPVDVDAFGARVRGMLSDGDALFVLYIDGHIVGTLALHSTHADGVLALGMSIRDRFRGRGGGRALLSAAVEHARGIRAHKIELEVWPDNERAIGLYRACGFEVEGVRRDHYRRRDGSLRSSQIMALLLE
ncbi:MAG: GNAT family N-acetyltransferase [Solirubrobacteraceae bacterium]